MNCIELINIVPPPTCHQLQSIWSPDRDCHKMAVFRSPSHTPEVTIQLNI